MAGVHRNTVTNVLNGKTQGRSMKAVIDAAKEHLKLKTEAISNELDEIAEQQERLRIRAKELATQI
jgi:chorismate synthase